jgi:hypothetical protein
MNNLGFNIKIRPRLLRLAKTCVWSSVILFSGACGLPDFSSEYAIASVKLAGGQTLYFKREVRGINGSYDVIAISANSDPCASQDDKSDYRICGSGEHVYYKFDGNILHLYGSTACSTPKQFPLHLTVENHEIHPIDWDLFKQDHPKQGIDHLSLILKPENRCK